MLLNKKCSKIAGAVIKKFYSAFFLHIVHTKVPFYYFYSMLMRSWEKQHPDRPRWKNTHGLEFLGTAIMKTRSTKCSNIK